MITTTLKEIQSELCQLLDLYEVRLVIVDSFTGFRIKIEYKDSEKTDSITLY